MKGAAAVVERSSSKLSARSTTRIGTGHHFLFWSRKYQKSFSKEGRGPSRAAFSRSLSGCSAKTPSPVNVGLAEVTADVLSSRFDGPVRILVGPPAAAEDVPPD